MRGEHFALGSYEVPFTRCLMQRFQLTMMDLSWLVAGDELNATRQFLTALVIFP